MKARVSSSLAPSEMGKKLPVTIRLKKSIATLTTGPFGESRHFRTGNWNCWIIQSSTFKLELIQSQCQKLLRSTLYQCLPTSRVNRFALLAALGASTSSPTTPTAQTRTPCSGNTPSLTNPPTHAVHLHLRPTSPRPCPSPHSHSPRATRARALSTPSRPAPHSRHTRTWSRRHTTTNARTASARRTCCSSQRTGVASAAAAIRQAAWAWYAPQRSALRCPFCIQRIWDSLPAPTSPAPTPSRICSKCAHTVFRSTRK